MKILWNIYSRLTITHLILMTFSLGITSCKKSSADTIHHTLDQGQGEKEKIREFWEFYRSAQKFRSEGNFLKARDGFQNALEVDPRHEDALFNYGNMCYELGDYEAAEKAWRSLIAVHPLNARGHYQLGNLYMRMENPDYYNLEKAEQEFNKALDLNREITGPLLRLGQISLIKNDLPKAESYFKQVNGTDIKNVEAYFHRGYIAWKANNGTDAVRLFSDAVKYSIPEKREGGVAVEGDTKDNKSLKRPIGESLFKPILINLSGMEESRISSEMKIRYAELDAFIEELRGR